MGVQTPPWTAHWLLQFQTFLASKHINATSVSPVNYPLIASESPFCCPLSPAPAPRVEVKGPVLRDLCPCVDMEESLASLTAPGLSGAARLWLPGACFPFRPQMSDSPSVGCLAGGGGEEAAGQRLNRFY